MFNSFDDSEHAKKTTMFDYVAHIPKCKTIRGQRIENEKQRKHTWTSHTSRGLKTTTMHPKSYREKKENLLKRSEKSETPDYALENINVHTEHHNGQLRSPEMKSPKSDPIC